MIRKTNENQKPNLQNVSRRPVELRLCSDNCWRTNPLADKRIAYHGEKPNVEAPVIVGMSYRFFFFFSNVFGSVDCVNLLLLLLRSERSDAIKKKEKKRRTPKNITRTTYETLFRVTVARRVFSSFRRLPFWQPRPGRVGIIMYYTQSPRAAVRWHRRDAAPRRRWRSARSIDRGDSPAAAHVKSAAAMTTIMH